MSVPVPASGSVISAVSLTNMHDAARIVINGVRADAFRRGSVGPQASQGLVIASGYKECYASAGITTEPAPFLEAEAWILAAWQDMGTGMGAYDYFLTPNVVLGPCILAVWTCFRLSYQAAAGASSVYGFNLGYSIDGVPAAPRFLTRSINEDTLVYDAGDPLAPHRLDYDVAIMGVIDLSAGAAGLTLNSLRLRAARCSIAGPGLAQTAYVEDGCVGFIAFKPQ